MGVIPVITPITKRKRRRRPRKPKSKQIVLINDESDGEIDDKTTKQTEIESIANPMNENDNIEEQKADHIETENIKNSKEERMKNKEIRNEQQAKIKHFDYDFFSQNQPQKAINFKTPSKIKSKNKKRNKIFKTPKINKIKLPKKSLPKKKVKKSKKTADFDEFLKSLNLQNNDSKESNSKDSNIANSKMRLPETSGFIKASPSFSKPSFNKRKSIKIKIKKAPIFNKAKFKKSDFAIDDESDQRMPESVGFTKANSFRSSKSKIKQNKIEKNEGDIDPYSIFMAAIPEFDEEHFDVPLNEQSQTEQQIDKMSDIQYFEYKQTLKCKSNLPETESIVSANTLKQRSIPCIKIKPKQINESKLKISNKQLIITPIMRQRAKQK